LDEKRLLAPLSIEFHNVLFFGSIAVAIVIVLCWCYVWNEFMGRNPFDL
jgi:hypothetical protein